MFQPNQNLYGIGISSTVGQGPSYPHYDVRAPTTSDTQYFLGQEWVWPGNGIWFLVTLAPVAGVLTATWEQAVSASGDVLSVTGTANQVLATPTTGNVVVSLIGPYTPATYTAHGVLIGEGTSSIAATAAGTTGQVLIGATGADPAFGALGVNSGLTAHGVLLGEGNSAIAATAVGATGTLLAGTTGADPAFTASPSVTGNMTAATGFVATTAGAGITLNSGATSGTTTATLNGRSGQITITTPTINAGATFAMTITNSSITGSATQILYGLTGGTTGSAITIQSVANTASQSVVTVQNASAVTNSTGSLVLTFLVLN